VTNAGGLFPLPWVGSFGPAIGGMAAIYSVEKKKGVKQFIRDAFPIKGSMRQYFIGLFAPMLVVFVVILLAPLFFDGSLQPTFSSELAGFIIVYIIFFIFGGSLGEEMGWRGFLLRELLTNLSGFWATIIVAIYWFIWHLPLFFWNVGGATQNLEEIVPFIVIVFSFSFVFTYVHSLGKRQNYLYAILLHTSFNWSLAFFPSLFSNAFKSETPLIWGTSIIYAVIALSLFLAKRINFKVPEEILSDG
jgi:membrane protease YdiL (CAAX protease family)